MSDKRAHDYYPQVYYPYMLPYTQYQPQYSYPYYAAPPPKRPRTEKRIKTLPRKTFSDFRISQVVIGAWRADTIRDSRIRFCFRNSHDRDPDTTLSAAEAALIAPDRISISLEGTHRIVVPAHHIGHIDFTRRSGNIVIETDGWAAFEQLLDTWTITDSDITDGQLSLVKRIEITLDLDKPLTEPKWTRGNLTDHVDGNSRFIKILNIVDGAQVTFDTILDRWADDEEKASFVKRLTKRKLLDLLSSLMNTTSILTKPILFLLTTTIEYADIEVIKSALFQIPEQLLFKALDANYTTMESELTFSTQRLTIRNKRQRGESEVPESNRRRRISDHDADPPSEEIYPRSSREELLYALEQAENDTDDDGR